MIEFVLNLVLFLNEKDNGYWSYLMSLFGLSFVMCTTGIRF